MSAKYRVLCIVSLILVQQSIGNTVAAQAYCNLRDPDRQISSIFPEVTSSTENIIDYRKNRLNESVLEAIPFPFDESELGDHAMYSVYNRNKLVGTLEAISIQGRWGFSEIIVAYNGGGELLNFAFQRCRSKHKESVNNDEKFREELLGKSLDELVQIYLDKSKHIDQSEKRRDDNVTLKMDVIKACIIAGSLDKKRA